MIAYAAVDLRGGRCVQLIGGRPDSTRVSLPDPVSVAARWRNAGFAALHIVDLDAALSNIGDVAIRKSGNASPAKGRQPEPSPHYAVIRTILEEVDIPVQVGGGVRDDRTARALLDAGAARVVVGTRAVEDQRWLERLAARNPGRVVAAVDVRGSEVVTRGWTERTGLNAADLLRGLDSIPLGGVLVTDVNREGGLEGPDLERFGALVAASRHPLMAAGGIRNAADLRRLDTAGAAGAVLGMSLYTGAADARAIAKEFAS